MSTRKTLALIGSKCWFLESSADHCGSRAVSPAIRQEARRIGFTGENRYPASITPATAAAVPVIGHESHPATTATHWTSGFFRRWHFASPDTRPVARRCANNIRSPHTHPPRKATGTVGQSLRRWRHLGTQPKSCPVSLRVPRTRMTPSGPVSSGNGSRLRASAIIFSVHPAWTRAQMRQHRLIDQRR